MAERKSKLTEIQIAVDGFKRKLKTEDWQNKIFWVLATYGIRAHTGRVYYDFEAEDAILEITPDEETFRSIVENKKPPEIKFFGHTEEWRNWDPKGISARMLFSACKQVVIASTQYVFSVDGELNGFVGGYKIEKRHNPTVPTDIDNFLVLQEK